MRIFLAGASGVIGSRLVPLLVSEGHLVAGMTRSRNRVELLDQLGAEPVVCDVFDADRLQDVITRFSPDLVMHQLTALPDDPSLLPDAVDANARIRIEGTDNLLAAARAAGAHRCIAQSVAWDLPGQGGDAVQHLESSVVEFGGTVLRYGQFYGPATYHPDGPPSHPRIHVDEAARLTLAQLESAPGIVVIAEEPDEA